MSARDQVGAAVTPPSPDPPKNTGLIVAIAVAVVAVLGLAVVSWYFVNQARQEASAAREDAQAALEALDEEREEADAAISAAEAASEAVASEAAAAEAQEEASAAAQEAEDDAERRRRQSVVSEIEDSVRVMAEEHVADDLIEGPVLSVACSPVAGGSLDDLTEVTTVFECFVVNEELDDGRSRGVTYNATMNWDTGQFTYGIGQP